MTVHSTTSKVCKLALADGTVMRGVAVGHRGIAGGELCFNTSMSGYQEILTDPSYCGQIVTMTNPHIGNYGASNCDNEAIRPAASGLVVRAFSQSYSNKLADESLDAFMRRHEIVGISGVDTRRIVRHLRSAGVMNAVISSTEMDEDCLIQRAREWPSMDGLELASAVTAAQAYDYASSRGPRVAVYDFGVKKSILDSMMRRGCAVRVFPADTDICEVAAWHPNGICFSNGPGDPRTMSNALANVRAAMETDLPLLGICLGHQLMALASGFTVFKMFVGHRGANHPVKNLETGRVEVTTQNHGFAVSPESIAAASEITHVNLNDGTVEGLCFGHCDGISVQYHPESSPGPHDSAYLLDEFVARVRKHASSLDGQQMHRVQLMPRSRLLRMRLGRTYSDARALASSDSL